MLLRRVRVARRHLSSDRVDSVRVGRAVTRTLSTLSDDKCRRATTRTRRSSITCAMSCALYFALLSARSLQRTKCK